jgi:hypothetical protein
VGFTQHVERMNDRVVDVGAKHERRLLRECLADLPRVVGERQNDGRRDVVGHDCQLLVTLALFRERARC